jgi:hypothetical protein
VPPKGTVLPLNDRPETPDPSSTVGHTVNPTAMEEAALFELSTVLAAGSFHGCKRPLITLNHFPPVLLPGQCAGQEVLNSGILQALARGLGILSGQVQPEKR